jgi:hypothetical protein
MRVQRIENLSLALDLAVSVGVKLVMIGPSDLEEGNLNIILGFIWSVLLCYVRSKFDDPLLMLKSAMLDWVNAALAATHQLPVADLSSCMLPEVWVHLFDGAFGTREEKGSREDSASSSSSSRSPSLATFFAKCRQTDMEFVKFITPRELRFCDDHVNLLLLLDLRLSSQRAAALSQ